MEEGHVWQGRFKAFPIQEDEHLTTVLRYVERNPVRAGLTACAQQWRWSSAACLSGARSPSFVHSGPAPRGPGWLEWANQPQTEAEVESLRECLRRGRPFGHAEWLRSTAEKLGLESSRRPRGRPRMNHQSG